MFRGYTLQMNNVLNASGQKTDASTLGYDVSIIFNGEFFDPSQPMELDTQRGVPLTRIDLSGYGASTFSNWINQDAQFAATSQARFDVLVGRTAHEVIQVKSILYPWGIRVVRTITLFRVGSGYAYRFDSGWKAESDGKFDFRFKFVEKIDKDKEKPVEKTAVPYKIHPGTVKGLFNIQNIKSAFGDILPVLGTMDITSFFEVYDKTNKVITYDGGASPVPVNLQPVYFDADVELESVVQGQVGGRVPGKKILGFVQLAPRGIPLTPDAFRALLDRQFGAPSVDRWTASWHRQERPEVPHQPSRRQHLRRRHRYTPCVRRRCSRQCNFAEGRIVEFGYAFSRHGRCHTAAGERFRTAYSHR